MGARLTCFGALLRDMGNRAATTRIDPLVGIEINHVTACAGMTCFMLVLPAASTERRFSARGADDNAAGCRTKSQIF